jgi:pimeloyl-ACP methyl ester carboxylesterase
LNWKVPVVKEAEYFLAAKFTESGGKDLTTRSEIVFVSPEYPILLAEAEKSLQAAAELASLPPVLKISLASVEMMLEDARMRWDDFGQAPRDWSYVKKTLQEVKSFSQLLAQKKDPFATQRGVFLKGYRSELDETLQPYAIYIPKSYNPAKSYPLLVSLHGATSNHRLNIRRVFGLGNRMGESDYEAVRNTVEFPEVDFIVVSPYGRGEIAGYNGIGENDVLRVMEDVKKAYHIDPDRVYLTGLSMGGGGTWHLGLRYPDLWAAIVPVCAIADVGYFGQRGTLDPSDRQLFDLTSAIPIAENACNMSVFIYHGDVDSAVDVLHSRKMAEAYEKLNWLGKRVQYFELPGVHHFAWDFSYRQGNIFKILAPIKRNPYPEHVVFSTFSPRYNKSHWLRIDRIEKGLQLARIEGTWKGNRFEIKTENVAAFSLLLGDKMVTPRQKIEVVANGISLVTGAAPEKTVSFLKSAEGKFAFHKLDAPLEGPPDHFEGGFRGRTLAQASAHVYVYGTGGGEAMTKASREMAEQMANWGSGVKVRWPVLADTEVSEEILKKNSLVLFGSTASNRILEQIKEKMPIKETGSGYSAGSFSLEQKDASYRLVAPSPLAPGRYVLIFGAMTAEGLLRLKPYAGGGWTPSKVADYLVLDGTGAVKKSGLFADKWEIAD